MTAKKTKSRYKKINGKSLIEVRVKDPLQLFDSRDPAPFRDRDLDDDFVSYIISSAREFGSKIQLKIAIYIEHLEDSELSATSIREAIQTYFAYQVELQRLDLKSFLKRSQLYLFIGIVILFVCLSAAENIDASSLTGVSGILREGLMIFGWVSLWKPIELILFDWYPLYQKIRLYKKLEETETEVLFGVKPQHR